MKQELYRKMNLQFFAENVDGDDPVVDPDIKGDDDTKDGKPEPKKLELTQEEFDRIIAERVSRTKKKYGDYDDIKSKLAELEKAEAERKKAEMTEQERLQAEKDELAKKAEAKEREALEVIEKANARLIKSEFKLLAKELGIRADALEDAYVLADKTSIKVDEGGAVEGVKETIEALIQSKSYLVEQKRQEPKQIGNPSNPAPDGEVKTLQAQLEDAKKKNDFSKVIELSNKIKGLLK